MKCPCYPRRRLAVFPVRPAILAAPLHACQPEVRHG